MSVAETVSQIFEDMKFAIVNILDNTKRLMFDLSGTTTGKTTTIKANATDNRVLLLPDKSGTLERLEADREVMTTDIMDYSTAEILSLTMTHSFTLDIHNPIQGKSAMIEVVPNGFSLSFHSYCKIISGRFKTNTVNYIYFHCINETEPVYIVTIGQQTA
jgi:hypothetical protein